MRQFLSVYLPGNIFMESLNVSANRMCISRQSKENRIMGENCESKTKLSNVIVDEEGNI